MTAPNIAFISTKSSMLNSRLAKHFQAVTFKSYKSKSKLKKNGNETEKVGEETKHNEFDMKRARHDVLKFGTSGLDPKKKEEAKIQLAIQLGAKPPKNKYINYKELQNQKCKENKDERKRMRFQQLGKNQIGKSIAHSKSFKRKKTKEGLLDKYGKVIIKSQ